MDACDVICEVDRRSSLPALASIKDGIRVSRLARRALEAEGYTYLFAPELARVQNYSTLSTRGEKGRRIPPKRRDP